MMMLIVPLRCARVLVPGIPSNGHYFLTDFDGTSCACGQCHSHGEYFNADRQRYGCGAYLNICRSGKCVKSYTVDYGPSCYVEDDAGGPVLDASPAICSLLTGHSSCGWSDHFDVTVARAAAPEVDGRAVGPFNVTDSELLELIRIGAELDAADPNLRQ